MKQHAGRRGDADVWQRCCMVEGLVMGCRSAWPRARTKPQCRHTQCERICAVVPMVQLCPRICDIFPNSGTEERLVSHLRAS